MAGNAFDHDGEIFLRGGVGVSLGAVRIGLTMVVMMMEKMMMMMMMMMMM